MYMVDVYDIGDKREKKKEEISETIFFFKNLKIILKKFLKIIIYNFRCTFTPHIHTHTHPIS
jgi:hypothetical protein